jgi:hypothetical protein
VAKTPRLFYLCGMKLRNELAARGVTLVAVSKMQPIDRILPLYQGGQRIFGESRVQELVQKYETLPKDIEWHQIGHLQRNKVKYIVPFIQLIHSVDTPELLEEIDRQAAKHQRVIDCLLQFHIASEETKFGFDLPEAIAMLETGLWKNFQHIRLCGVMGMASFSDDQTLVHAELKSLMEIFTVLKQRFFQEAPWFKERSMGMSGDWELAVEEGSTMVRIGSLLFNH